MLVNESTVDTEPNCNISADLGGNKLRKATHAGHSLWSGQPVDQMLSEVRLDGLQVLYFIFINKDPYNRKVHVKVTHHFSSCN